MFEIFNFPRDIQLSKISHGSVLSAANKEFHLIYTIRKRNRPIYFSRKQRNKKNMFYKQNPLVVITSERGKKLLSLNFNGEVLAI